MADILHQIRHIYEGLCALPNGSALQELRKQYSRLMAQLEHAVVVEKMGETELQSIYLYVHQIRHLSQAAVNLNELLYRSQQSVNQQLASCFKAKQDHETRAQDIDSGDSYDPWRSWYTDHIAHPYYDNRERDWLLKQVPDMTPQKMQTWFVNVRRRSGWSELYKKYADNKRANMEAIFKACDDPDPAVNEKVVPEARKLVARIRQYLTLESKKTEIAPWLSELLNNYKQSSIKAIKSEDSDESKPFTPSSAGKNLIKSNKRKASDMNSNITPSKRSKPSLYKTSHHPPTPASSVSPYAPSKPTPSVPATGSASERSSPDLQTAPSVYKSNKEESPEHSIPPFSAWTPPTQSLYIQQAPAPLSAFVPAQAPSYAHAYALPPPLQVQAPAQSFISNNHITYNVSPTSYAYPQLHQSPPLMYGMHGMPASSSWNQPSQWPHTFQYPEPAYYTPASSISHPQSNAYSMLSNLSNTLPGKRKYTEEEEEIPPTPTSSYKRGRTSASSYPEPAIVDSISVLPESAYQYDASWESLPHGLGHLNSDVFLSPA